MSFIDEHREEHGVVRNSGARTGLPNGGGWRPIFARFGDTFSVRIGTSSASAQSRAHQSPRPPELG